MPPPKPRSDLPDNDAPEADAAWFKRARPASEVLPVLVGPAVAAELLKPRRGRRPTAGPKVHVNIRLDADILLAFKRSGPGWQARLNQALREWLASR